MSAAPARHTTTKMLLPASFQPTHTILRVFFFPKQFVSVQRAQQPGTLSTTVGCEGEMGLGELASGSSGQGMIFCRAGRMCRGRQGCVGAESWGATLPMSPNCAGSVRDAMTTIGDTPACPQSHQDKAGALLYGAGASPSFLWAISPSLQHSHILSLPSLWESPGVPLCQLCPSMGQKDGSSLGS